MQPLLQYKSHKYNILCVYVCSLRYPARNAHSPYCNLWTAPAPLYYSSLSYKGHDFREKKRNNLLDIIVSWFSLQLLSTFLVLRRNSRDMIRNVDRSACKVPLFLSDFNEACNFLDRLSKNTQISNFPPHKNPSSGSRVISCGRTAVTYMTKLTVAYCNFANAPKKSRIIPRCFIYTSDVKLFSSRLTALLCAPTISYWYHINKSNSVVCCQEVFDRSKTMLFEWTVNYSCICKRLNLNAHISFDA